MYVKSMTTKLRGCLPAPACRSLTRQSFSDGAQAGLEGKKSERIYLLSLSFFLIRLDLTINKSE